jgi:hypothetical protein
LFPEPCRDFVPGFVLFEQAVFCHSASNEAGNVDKLDASVNGRAQEDQQVLKARPNGYS